MYTEGAGVTVNGTDTGHPFDASVNVILAVPNDTPETTPVLEVTDAIVASLLIHVPAAASLSVTDVARHVPEGPVIGLVLLIVMVVVVVQPVGSV